MVATRAKAFRLPDPSSRPIIAVAWRIDKERAMTDWLNASYMARKGVAKGAPGRRHELDEKTQGTYHYVYGPYVEPVLRIEPGDIVVVETKDAFENKITSERDSPSKILNMPFVNPQNGPIAVEGAEKGDVLCVHIHSIKPRGPQPA